ncbi:MAG TPA: hypothetical protein VF796_04325, partial [Humisphaera sp.]
MTSRLAVAAFLLAAGTVSVSAAPPAKPGAMVPPKLADRAVIELKPKAAVGRFGPFKADAAGNYEPWDDPKKALEWNRVEPDGGWYDVEVVQGSPNADGAYEVAVDGQAIAVRVTATGGFDKL